MEAEAGIGQSIASAEASSKEISHMIMVIRLLHIAVTKATEYINQENYYII